MIAENKLLREMLCTAIADPSDSTLSQLVEMLQGEKQDHEPRALH